MTLNLKHPRAAGVLHALVRTADATFDNLRGDQPEKLGVTYARLAEFNPKLVCAHLSAYGREGPRKAWPGYDYLMQAEAGYLSVTGEPDGPPSRMGLSIVDLMTGLNAAFALVSGVLSARATGKGRDIDVNLFDTALQNLCYLAVWYLNAGVNQGREPRSSHPSLTPSQLYRTRDGFIFIMCNKEKFWPELCDCIGRPEWSTRADYKDFKARLANREQLTEELDAVLSTRTTAEWIEVFGGRGARGTRQRRARRAGKPVRDGGRARARRPAPLRPHPPPRFVSHMPRGGDALPRGARHGRGHGCGSRRSRIQCRRGRRPPQSRRSVKFFCCAAR